MNASPLEVNGTPPLLAEQVCREILFEQYWDAGELLDSANVSYFHFGDIWHRLTFDHGIIFWSRQAERPSSYSMPELDAEARIDNAGERIGLAGKRLLSYSAHAIGAGSEVAFHFEHGQTLTVRNVGDRTSWAV